MVVLDFEFNQAFELDPITRVMAKVKNKPDLTNEIIEIGAIKASPKFKIIDTFRMFVKPVLTTMLNPNVRKKTGISNSDLAYGFHFKPAIRHLKEWIADDYWLYTWGNEDYHELLKGCCFHKVKDGWLHGYTDVQKMCAEFFNREEKIGLESAVKLLGIEETFVFHRALNDCHYTLAVLKHIVESGYRSKTNVNIY